MIIEYVATNTGPHRIDACAKVLVDGEFLAHIYPNALSSSYVLSTTTFPYAGITILDSDNIPLNIDVRRKDVERTVRTLARSLPPF